MERSFTASPGPADPAGQPEIDKTYQVIGMMVREQQTADLGKRDAELVQAPVMTTISGTESSHGRRRANAHGFSRAAGRCPGLVTVRP